MINCRELAAAVCAYAEGRDTNLAPLWRAQSYRQTVGEPMTVRRAKALNAILENCDLPVWPGELLVGLGNPTRLARAADVDRNELQAARALCRGIGGRDFTTHADHHAPDYPALVAAGFGGLAAAVDAQPSNPFLASVRVALTGAAAFLRRWSERLRLAASESPAFRDLLVAQSARLKRLAAEPPECFVDALQLVFSFHCMTQLDERGAMAFGRLDQFLLPFYRADIAAGRLTADRAQAVLDHFFAKITVDGDIQNIALGGVKPDDGTDATNELSFLILEACRRVGRPGGNCTARVHRRTPPAFLRKCGEVIRTGIGYPAVFNDDVQIPVLVDLGYSLEDARDYCFVGCIEVFTPGKMPPWSDTRFNTLAVVNDTVYHCAAETWASFFAAFSERLREALRQHVANQNAVRQDAVKHAEELTSPLLSALLDDCIARGKDMNNGGARYPANVGTGIMGIGVAADALMAVKRFVYDEPRFTLTALRSILDADFEGYEEERQLLLHGAPKYGNDIEAVDRIAVAVTRLAGEELLRHRNPQGGYHWGLMAANIQNISAGREVGASPDGRKAGQPLSDAASPTFGRDAEGPTAAVKSVARLPYEVCPGGNVINMKLHPSVLEGDAGLEAFARLVRTCFDLGGIQLQFNTTDRETLKAAIADPERFADLVVRVSGFSAHFTSLDYAVQEDILARTEHRLSW